ncbi:Flap-structured DNA-binding and RNA-binding protein [Saitoella coloradoensis]
MVRYFSGAEMLLSEYARIGHLQRFTFEEGFGRKVSTLVSSSVAESTSVTATGSVQESTSANTSHTSRPTNTINAVKSATTKRPSSARPDSDIAASLPPCSRSHSRNFSGSFGGVGVLSQVGSPTDSLAHYYLPNIPDFLNEIDVGGYYSPATSMAPAPPSSSAVVPPPPQVATSPPPCSCPCGKTSGEDRYKGVPGGYYRPGMENKWVQVPTRTRFEVYAASEADNNTPYTRPYQPSTTFTTTSIHTRVHPSLWRRHPRRDPPTHPTSVHNIPRWLALVRLHKYTPLFAGMKWEDMIKLGEEDLEGMGVSALGARKKFVRLFGEVRGWSGGAKAGKA